MVSAITILPRSLATHIYLFFFLLLLVFYDDFWLQLNALLKQIHSQFIHVDNWIPNFKMIEHTHEVYGQHYKSDYIYIMFEFWESILFGYVYPFEQTFPNIYTTFPTKLRWTCFFFVSLQFSILFLFHLFSRICQFYRNTMSLLSHIKTSSCSADSSQNIQNAE